jgi:uridine monophosphate synthetase
VVLIDRQSGAREALAEAGYRMHAIFTLSELLTYWRDTARLPAEQIEKVFRFLEDTAKE